MKICICKKVDWKTECRKERHKHGWLSSRVVGEQMSNNMRPFMSLGETSSITLININPEYTCSRHLTQHETDLSLHSSPLLILSVLAVHSLAYQLHHVSAQISASLWNRGPQLLSSSQSPPSLSLPDASELIEPATLPAPSYAYSRTLSYGGALGSALTACSRPPMNSQTSVPLAVVPDSTNNTSHHTVNHFTYSGLNWV